tara:strand:- start:14 stop:1204 length:1191 start_codon:yes stop_codon:yes gene_type:complete
VQSICDNQYTIVLKSRQVGASETVCSYLLCRALTEPGFSACVFSKTATDSGSLGKRIRAQAASIADSGIEFTTESNSELSFKGLGTIYFLPATPRAARGIPSVSVVVLDEAAFLDGAEQIFTAVQPTMATLGDKGKLIMISTPNGLGNMFSNLWHTAEEWNKFKIHYSDIPIYAKDPKWAEKTKRRSKLTDRAFRQEYELDFVASDAQIYQPDLVELACNGECIEAGFVGREYVMAVDPAAGGDDFWCSIVMDVTQVPYRVVNVFRMRHKSSDYCIKQIIEQAEDFMPAKVIIEKNGVGAVVSEVLSMKLAKYMVEPYNTNRPNKISNTDRVAYLLEREELMLPRDPFFQELLMFQQMDNGDRRAGEGAHDDSVMALALACSVVATTPTADWLDMV